MRPFRHLDRWLRAGALTAIATVAVALPAQDSTRAPAPDSARAVAPDTTHAAPPAATPTVATDTTRAAAPDTTLRAPAAPTPAVASDTTHAAPPVATQTAASDTNPPVATDTTAGQRHLVKKGDTLWDLAHTYLSDPFRWPEIYRMNTDLVRDPHWIYPGQKLRIPGVGGTPGVVGMGGASSDSAGGADSVGGAPAARLAVADATTPYYRPRQLSEQSTGPTVFALTPEQRYSQDPTLSASPGSYPHPVVRRGEFEAAPWVDREGGPRGAGELVGSAQIPGIAEASQRTRLSTEERAYITLPSGATASVGQRFVVFALGPLLPDGSQVMVPTGIMQVERTGGTGEATTARLVQAFGAVILGQKIEPLDQFNMPADVLPQPTTIGTESSVVAVPSGVVLPTIQRYVILGTTAKDGVQMGDEFTLYRPGKEADLPSASGTVRLPEEPIAVAQVVRVTDRGTTAIIVSQREPAIAAGVHARLTAKMP